jgi:hypothetical protein
MLASARNVDLRLLERIPVHNAAEALKLGQMFVNLAEHGLPEEHATTAVTRSREMKSSVPTAARN